MPDHRNSVQQKPNLSVERTAVGGTLLPIRASRVRRHRSPLHSMKRFIPVLRIFAAIASLGSLQAEDLVSATNQTLKPIQELHVTLEKAHYISTVRLSAGYVFAVKGNPSPDQPAVLSLTLSQGSDVDDRGRDSIQRLNAFFSVVRTNSSPEEAPMTIQNTNIVTLRIFKSGWLFRDERGRIVAIGNTHSREWLSKRIIEQFGAANGSHPIHSETNSASEAAGSRR